jgi:hypothetical protein
LDAARVLFRFGLLALRDPRFQKILAEPEPKKDLHSDCGLTTKDMKNTE